jgi:hypothetical protein
VTRVELLPPLDTLATTFNVHHHHHSVLTLLLTHSSTDTPRTLDRSAATDITTTNRKRISQFHHVLDEVGLFLCLFNLPPFVIIPLPQAYTAVPVIEGSKADEQIRI